VAKQKNGGIPQKPKRHARCACGHLFRDHSIYPNCDHEVGGQCVRGTCAGRCGVSGCKCKAYHAKPR
jgi:hypothetical protein